jgi:hypothetical protein
MRRPRAAEMARDAVTAIVLWVLLVAVLVAGGAPVPEALGWGSFAAGLLFLVLALLHGREHPRWPPPRGPRR